MFQEAIDHCRWKNTLKNTIKKIEISEYNNKTFEEIIVKIYSICKNIKGLGLLAIYDITSAICRFYKINIDKVYIIGNGPKRAIKLLNLKTKTHKINENIKIKYVAICDIVNAFDKKNYKLSKDLRDNKNGDIFETFICKWQKTIFIN